MQCKLCEESYYCEIHDPEQYEEMLKRRNCMHQFLDQKETLAGTLYTVCEDCGEEMTECFPF